MSSRPADASGASEPFFRSRWVEAPAGVEELDPAQLAPGFRAGGAHCGLKGGGKTDVGLLVCDEEAVSSALVLTRNASAAAPIRVCREVVDRDRVRAAVVNSGNANAETGEQGYADALGMCERAADALGLDTASVAVAETGTIGVPLPIEAVLPGIDEAAASALRRAAAAPSPTRSSPPTAGPSAAPCSVDGVTLSAQAKGAGMIEPKMATMLCFVQTDAVVADPDAALRAAVDASFNRITVDGQMSTNDCVLLQATGAAGEPLPRGPAGGGADAAGDRDRPRRRGRRPGRPDRGQRGRHRRPRPSGSPARSPTRRWSRPRSSAATPTGAGSPRPPARRWSARTWRRSAPTRSTPPSSAAETAEAEIGLRLGRGEHRAHVWFSDLGYEYVRINAEYTT